MLYPNMLKCRSHKTINFPIVLNGKLMVLGVPIFQHSRIRSNM